MSWVLFVQVIGGVTWLAFMALLVISFVQSGRGKGKNHDGGGPS